MAGKNPDSVKFEVFTAMKIQVVVFRVVTPSNNVVGYQRFGGPCWLHLQSKMNVDIGEGTREGWAPHWACTRSPSSRASS